MKRLILALLLLCLSAPCLASEARVELLEPVGVQIDTARAYTGEISDIALYSGSIVPRVEELYFTSEGRVGEILVNFGQEVSQGQPLVTLDRTDAIERRETLIAQIDARKTSLEYDREIALTDIEILEAELARLRARPDASPRDIAIQELDIEAQKLALEHAQALGQMDIDDLNEALAEIEDELGEAALVSPIAGRLAFGTVLKPGDYVNAYDPIRYIADDTRLFIECEYISSMYVDSAVEIYALIGDKRYEVTVEEVDQSEYVKLVLSGATLTTRFLITDIDSDVKSGMYAAICMVRRRAEDALVVPSNAVFRGAYGRYVYVVTDGERERREVKVGLTTSWLTQITEGLSEGEVVYVKD